MSDNPHTGDETQVGEVDLLAALRNLRRRFHAALVHTGTDPEFADAACAEADAAITRATGKSSEASR
jgi:chemotaxis regulatin CheY-phosphate phosphatase CheZ